MKLILKISVCVMIAVTAAMLILGTRQIIISDSEDFKSSLTLTVIIMLFSVFSVFVIASLFMQKFSLKKLGFYILHAGLVISLGGFVVYHAAGIKIAGSYRINEAGSSVDSRHEMVKPSHLEDDKYTANFNSFNLGVTDFIIEKYDVVYDVYEVFDLDNDNYVRVLSDVEKNKDGYFDFGKYGKIHSDEAQTDGKYVTVGLSNELDGEFVAAPRNPDKFYQAHIAIQNKESGEISYETLEVNHTQRVNGWKIYLMGSGGDDSEYVSLLFKYDPGEYITLTGIWMIIIGSAIACFTPGIIKSRRKAGDLA